MTRRVCSFALRKKHQDLAEVWDSIPNKSEFMVRVLKLECNNRMECIKSKIKKSELHTKMLKAQLNSILDAMKKERLTCRICNDIKAEEMEIDTEKLTPNEFYQRYSIDIETLERHIRHREVR